MIIALSGWKQSGKDTCADFLCKQYNFTKFSFANVLKDFVAERYGIPRFWCDDPKYKESPLSKYPVNPQDPFSRLIANFLVGEFKFKDNNICDLYWTPRALCILEGGVKRSVNPNFWVKRVIDEINKDISKNYVISDMRYQSEAESLKQSFGEDLITIRINRFHFNPSQDPSEHDLDDYSFTHIINKDIDENFSVKQIQQSITKIMEQYNGQ